MKIEFPATTGENPIVEGDKVTINYTPENTDGTAGTPTTLTYTYTGGNWVQDEKDSLKLTPTTDQSGKVSVTIPEDKVADKTSVSATTTDVAGRTSAESETSKKDAPFDVKSDKPEITSIKAIDTSTTADKDPERVIIEGTSTEADGTKVYLYKEGQTNGQPIAETTVTSGKFKFDISEPTATPLAVGDRFVATVQTFAGDKATEEVSQPSDAFTVPEVKVGKHNDADVANSGGHTGDTTEPTTAPTLEALTDDANLGAVKVKLPEDAKDGDRVIVKFTPESATTTPATPVEVTLTKGANGWTSDKPDLIANPVNGNEVTIEKGKVKDNTDVTAVIKDLADNEKAASPNATAYPNERTPLSSVTLEKAIDTDAVSNATPEKFTIKGTAEKDATVTATIALPNGEKVVIGTFKVTEEDGSFSFDTTDIKKDDALKAKLPGFTFNTENGQATPITVEATKEGKAPSHAQTVNAKAAEKGQAEQHTEKDAPANPTITPYMEGFGGAKVELPVAQAGEQLEMTLTLTPNAENGTTAGTPETAKTAKLVNNGSGWSVEGTDALVTIKEVGGKQFAIISAEKAPNGGKLTAEIKDFAGNKADAKVNNDKGELQANTTEATLSKAAGDEVVGRTDTPTIKAGSDNDAGDIVATPGADNTKMELTYVDQNGQPKTITVVKDMEAGEWKVQGEKPDTVIVDPNTGKITVPADLAKDGEEAKAVGFKGDNDDPRGSEKPYDQPYTHADGTPGSFEVVDEKKITVNASDKSVNAADPVAITPLTDKFAGAATVKGGTDNVKVEMVVTGYVDASGQIVTKEHAAKQAGTDTPTTKELILFAVKDPKTGEWTVVGTTKDKYDAAPENQKETVLSPISNDIATVTKDGTITLKANALQDNSAVKAKGYDALGNTNPTSDYQSQNVGEDPRDKDVDADEPHVPMTAGDGSMLAKPGDDNTSMKVTFTKGGQEQSLEIVKDENTNKWKVKDGSQITANGEASVEDGQITLSNGAKLNPNTGEVYFPAGTVDFDSEFTAVGTNKDGYESESVSKPVLEDPTSVAEAPIAVVEGNKVVVTPGADSKSITLQGTNLDTAPVIEKGSNGEWALKNAPIDGISVDAKTGKITIDSSKIAADGQGIVAEATDGWKPTANTASSNGGQGVRPMIIDNDARSTEAPTISAHKSGEKQGSVDITPQKDHNSVTVDYKDEQDRPQSITATRNPETGEWSLQPIVTTDEHGNTVVTPVPASKATIDPTSGVISLKADELKDGENITATGRDVNGNTKESSQTQAPNDPEGTKLPESEQPTDVPEVPATPPTPPQAETPTLFENVSIGKVKITPGQGVDYLSFKVQVDTREEGTGQIPQQNTYLHYVLVKNDSNGWDQFVYKITDLNDNGSIDETGDRFENVTNDPNTMKLVEESGVFTLSEKQFNQGNLDMRTRLGAVLADKVEQNDKTDKIFDIVIGREGSETITLPNSNGKTNNTTLSDKGAVKDFTLIKANEFEASTNTPSDLSKAPMYQHMLSTGEELTAPVFTVKKVNGKTEIEVLVDENNQAVGFELSSYTQRYEYNTHYLIKQSDGQWVDASDSWSDTVATLVERDRSLDANGKIGFRVKSASGLNLSVDDSYVNSDPGNHWQLKNIIYGANKSSDPTGMDKFYPITVTEDGTYTASESKPIALPSIDLRNPDATVTTKPPMPELPPQPSQPAETVNEPSATQDNSKQGGVKVKPAESNGGSKYSVNYVDEATGQSRVINVKKTDSTWAFEQEGSTGLIDNQKIQLNANTGELTFAPEAVRDGGKVTITAYDSQGSARAQKEVVAADEPITVKLIRDTASENIGGAKATPATGTNKFKLTFTDEGNNINVSKPTAHNVVYEKVNGSWKVVEVDGQKSSNITINGVSVDLNTQQNGYLTVSSSTGEVTIDRNSLKDGSTVSMIPYSKRGTESSGNAKTITTEKDKLVTALDDTSQNLSQLRGTDHAWGEVAINGNGSYVYGLAQLVHGKRHDGSTTNNAKATVTPLTQQENAATVSNNKGKRLNYSDNNDVVKIGERVMNKWTWDPTLKFDFKKGDDILAVGHDLGYGSENYSGLKSEYEHWQKVADRYRVQVDMGAGNDILAVGFHDTDWDVLKDRNTGVIDIHKRSGGIHGYEKVEFLNSNEWYGGQLAGAKVFMGDGNDTVILKGTPVDRNGQRASKNSIIDLGEGDNRLVLTPGENVGRAMSSTKVVAGSGNDVVKGDSFIESTDIRLGGGSDEFIARKVENTLVDLGHGDDWAEVKGEIGNGAQILLGAGNDVFEMKAGLSPNNSRVDGGSGVDTLLISRDGAHITNHNLKGFENVGLKANNITVGIRADYFGLIEGPMKITKADNVSGARVDLGMNGNKLSNAQGAQPDDKADGDYRWTKESMKAEGDTTYNVYKYVAGPYYVWIEDGINVI
ncbi:hypothetical protein P9Z71_07965 [Glaesserella parasuis]|uniref:hypothetical protein n=1 Tax=Glaesserella parasuis TaxID=738 RepID=UPI002436D5F7|nr:hypothetical protein [Glaesserella parasuis]MDG6310153.1 hypothetical protein [Glaesserella parasuis]